MSGALPIPLDQGPAVGRAVRNSANSLSASLPVTNPTKAFWTHSTPDCNPLAAEGSDGPLTAEADVCIIGSGITGVSIAYHLSNLIKKGDSANPRVVIIEARDFCSGATGRNGGHLTAHNFLDFASNWKAYGLEEAKRAFEIENYTSTEIDQIVRKHGLQQVVDYVVGGRTVPAFSDNELDEMKTSYEAAKAAGLDVSSIEWLSSHQVQEKYGASYPAIRQPGCNLWPLKLVTALYQIVQEARKLDVHLHTRTPVTAVDGGPGHWVLQTPRGTISTPTVIHATNGYASHLLPHLAGSSGIVPVRGQVLALRASTSAEALTRSSWLANEGFEYWFPRPVHGEVELPIVILGGGRETAGPTFETFESDDSLLNPRVGSALRKFLPTVFPGKYEEGSDSNVLMEWTGIMGHTRSGDPLVGPVIDSNGDDKAFAGQYICAGYTGHGMPRAYACAETIARIVAAKLSGSDEWEVPSWLPRHYLTSARPGDGLRAT
ncbi:FAD dependent oxidoreductase [Peniophora sp. CONT]|nr:FAD dependent oxidoreductase [Peniophora sp. CONT]